MTKEEAKELLPIIQAFAEGKTIEICDNRGWRDLIIDSPKFDCEPSCYRIKPESKYRPFKNADECWTEMQKHQPFGWLKRKDCNEYNLLTSVDGSVECEGVRIDSDGFGWDRANDEYTFADGTPFGIRDEQ